MDQTIEQMKKDKLEVEKNVKILLKEFCIKYPGLDFDFSITQTYKELSNGCSMLTDVKLNVDLML